MKIPPETQEYAYEKKVLIYRNVVEHVKKHVQKGNMPGLFLVGTIGAGVGRQESPPIGGVDQGPSPLWNEFRRMCRNKYGINPYITMGPKNIDIRYSRAGKEYECPIKDCYIAFDRVQNKKAQVDNAKKTINDMFK